MFFYFLKSIQNLSRDVEIVIELNSSFITLIDKSAFLHLESMQQLAEELVYYFHLFKVPIQTSPLSRLYCRKLPSSSLILTAS
jgi:hypothetical protein